LCGKHREGWCLAGLRVARHMPACTGDRIRPQAIAVSRRKHEVLNGTEAGCEIGAPWLPRGTNGDISKEVCNARTPATGFDIGAQRFVG